MFKNTPPDLNKNLLMDLPAESAAALMNTMVELVRENASLEITVTRELLPIQGTNLSMFVVTLSPEATEEQRAEAEYWLNEVAPLFRYAERVPRQAAP